MIAVLWMACFGDGVEDRADVCAPEPRSVAANLPCICDVDCVSGDCFREEVVGSPHGECIQACLTPADCGEGYLCVLSAFDSTDVIGDCELPCTTADDCPGGRSCTTITARGDGDVQVCTPQCVADDECRSGRCNVHSGDCLADDEPDPEGGGVGAACSDNGDCQSGSCSGGECRTSCNPERGTCPDGAQCAPFDDGFDGICRFACETDADCEGRVASTCEVWSDRGPEQYCVPPGL